MPGGADADHQASLTEEEKYVLAKIIVAIDSKLEKELEAVKAELADRTVEEDRVQERLERERDQIVSLERELREVREELADKEKEMEKEKEDGAGRQDGGNEKEEGKDDLAAERTRMAEQLAEAEADHERSIRAIQRVLADVTTDRDEKIEELGGKVEAMTTERDELKAELAKAKDAAAAAAEAAAVASPPPAVDNGTVEALEQERAKVRELTEEVERLKSTPTATTDDHASTLEEERSKVRQLTEEVERLQSERRDVSASLARGGEFDKVQAENDALRRDLQNKESNLETAKMMITALETANGSQANDLRAKLKERNGEVASLKIKVEGDGNEIESLKAEVLDLQKKFVEAERSGREAKAQLRRQRFVHRQLKAEISKISNNNVTTTRGDNDNEEEVEVAIVGEVSAAVQKSLSILVEEGDGREDAPAGGEGDYSDGGGGEVDDMMRQLERLAEEKESMASKLNSELAKRSAALSDMEDTVKEQKEEFERFRTEVQESQAEQEASIVASQAEIQRLRDECAVNADLLVIKEQELTVLRESLNEPSTGYISDDDESDDENEGEEEVSPDVAARSAKLSVEAENLELMLVKGNASSMSLGALSSDELKIMQTELESFRRERQDAVKKSKEQEESLANAKMIISSLEKSNKSMCEDLRNRLHDSNTAIVSLLEKSAKHEEAAASLKAELEQLRREKEKDKSSHEMEAKRIKEEATETATKLDEQNRQVEELQKSVERYESYARRMRINDDSTVSSLGTDDEGSFVTKTDYSEADGKFPVTSPMTIPRDSEEEV